MHYLASELEWSLVNEPETLLLLDEHIESLYSVLSVIPKECGAYLVGEVREITGSISQSNSIIASLLNIHQAQITFAKQKGYIEADLLLEDSEFKGPITIKGSKILFSGNIVVRTANDLINDSELELILKANPEEEQCFFKLASGANLKAKKLVINIDGNCDVVIAGGVDVNSLLIASLNKEYVPKIFIMQDASLNLASYLKEQHLLKGVTLVNYYSDLYKAIDLSHFTLSLKTFENYGNVIMSRTSAYIYQLFNDQKATLSLQEGATLVVKKTLINLGMIGVSKEIFILNSNLYSNKAIKKAISQGYAIDFAYGGVFYNKGEIITEDSTSLLKISNFQLVINGLGGEINACLDIHTTHFRGSYDAIINIGGRIYVQEGSSLNTEWIANYPNSPLINALPGYIIFQGGAKLTIKDQIYNYESYFGGIKGKIEFIESTPKIKCHAAVKSCIFQGNVVGKAKQDARDLSKHSNPIAGNIALPPLEEIASFKVPESANNGVASRAAAMQASKIIALHRILDDQKLRELDSFSVEQELVIENPDTSPEACLRQFEYVNKVPISITPGLGEQLCNMGYRTTHKQKVLFDGGSLEKFLQTYEMLIFGQSLDILAGSKNKKMLSLTKAGEEAKDTLSLKLLKPLPEDVVPPYHMIWPVEIKNSQGASIIVPYIYLSENFKKEDSLVNIKYLSNSQLLLESIITTGKAVTTIEGGGLKAITDGSTVAPVTFAKDIHISASSTLELKDGYVIVEGSLINKGLIQSLGFSLIEAKERIINLGTIVGDNLLMKTKSLMIEVLVSNILPTEYSTQLVLASQSHELKILNEGIYSRPKVNLDGTLIIEVEDIAKIEAAEIKANKIAIRSNGKILIIPTAVYKKISNWWGSGFYSKESLTILTSTLEAEEIEITSEDATLIYSTKFKGDITIHAKKELLLDVLSNEETTKKVETSVKKSWFSLVKKVTTREEFSRVVAPVLNEFIGEVTINAEGGLRLVGINVDNAKTHITSGTEDFSALVEIIPATKVMLYDVNTQTKKSFLGFRVGKSQNLKRAFMQQSIINVVKSENSFYGYSYGKWFQLATYIEGSEIYIGASDDIALPDAKNIAHMESNFKKAGFALWTDSNIGGISIGAGMRYRHLDSYETQIESIPNIFIGNFVTLESKKDIPALVAFFDVKDTLKIKANTVNFGIGENSQYITASSLFYQIGINFGVRFGPGTAIRSIENLAAQNLDSTIGQVNAAFAAIQAYTAVSELIKAVSTAGVSAIFSFGAWAGFSIEKSKETIEKTTVTPTIINARNIICEAEDISIKATQIFAFDAYFKAKRLNIDPAEVSFKSDSTGNSFGMSFTTSLNSIFGEKLGDQIGSILQKLRLGTIPIGEFLPSFALNKGNIHEIRYHNARIHVSGNLHIEIELEANIRGADIVANTLFASFDKLILESVQDVIKNKEWSASVGLSNQVIHKLTHLSGNYKEADGLLVDQITRLVGKESATIIVAGALHLHGAMIANAEINEQGGYTDKGKLTLEVGDLFIKYLQNHDNGVIVGTGYEFLNKQLGAKRKNVSPGSEHLSQETRNGFNFKPEFGTKSKSGRVLATIGEGKVYIRGTTQGDEINKNLNAANQMGGVPSQMKTVKGFFSTETPSFAEFTEDLKGASEYLQQDFKAIDEALNSWLTARQESQQASHKPWQNPDEQEQKRPTNQKDTKDIYEEQAKTTNAKETNQDSGSWCSYNDKICWKDLKLLQSSKDQDGFYKVIKQVKSRCTDNSKVCTADLNPFYALVNEINDALSTLTPEQQQTIIGVISSDGPSYDKLPQKNENVQSKCADNKEICWKDLNPLKYRKKNE